MGSHSSDQWAEDTTTTRRARSPRREGAAQPRTGLASIPIYIWLLGVVVVLLVLTVLSLWALYLLRGQWAETGPTPTPIIWTPSPAPLPTDTPPAAPATPGPTAPVPTASPEIAVGGYVKVTGTEGTGLSLREGPGSNYARMDVALENEVFLIVAGPVAAGDAQWWKVRDPNNERRDWWAAANYLVPVDQP